MTAPATEDGEEALAIKRFYLMGAARFGGLAMLLGGIAIAQNAIEAPYWLGVGLAVGGMLTFFFGPYFLAKRWKKQQSDQPE